MGYSMCHTSGANSGCVGIGSILSTPTVAIVILNWRKPESTLECLEAIAHLNYPAGLVQVIVVDNASQDRSAEIIREAFPGVMLVENSENMGYAGGNNVGIRTALAAGSDYTWILNNDVLVQPDALSRLVQTAEVHPEAAFFGPLVKSRLDPEQIISAGGKLVTGWRAVLRGTGELDQGQYRRVEAVDFLSGCALLVRNPALDNIGLLDERYFLYHEDVEWCSRAQAQGFGVAFVPNAVVWHPDTRSRDEHSAQVTYYITRNSLLFVRKYLGGWTLLKALTGYLRNLLSWTVKPRWREKKHQRNALFWALMDFVRGKYGRRATG